MKPLALFGVLALGFLFVRSVSAAPREIEYTQEELNALLNQDGELSLPDIYKAVDPADFNLAIPLSPGMSLTDDMIYGSFSDFDGDPFGVQSIDAANPETEAALNEIENMNVEQLIEAVADHLMLKEGLRLFVYDDATGKPWAQSQKGNPTIGYGHMLKAGEPVTWTLKDESEAYALLVRDITLHLTPIIKKVHVPLSLMQWVAVASLAFNAGAPAVANSRFIKAVNAQDWFNAEREFKDWNKATVKVNGVPQKVIVAGLTNRRNEEWNMFMQNTPVVYLA